MPGRPCCSHHVKPASTSSYNRRGPACDTWFYAEGSWATLSTLEGPPYQVSQAGPRRLYDEVEAGYTWWLQRGRPGIEAWRVALDRNGQQRLYLEA